MNLALNNLQMLICHKTQTTNNYTKDDCKNVIPNVQTVSKQKEKKNKKNRKCSAD